MGTRLDGSTLRERVSLSRVAAALVVAALAVLPRLYGLDARPAHWDEGVHAYYAREFLATGEFAYEPWRHGPLLYYLSVPVMWLAGEGVAAGRAAVALVSLGTFPALYLLREEAPRPALVFSALVLAAHPYVLATARFYRNDAMLATFALLLVGCYARYYRTGAWYWALAAGAAAGFAFASKEVAFLVVPAILASILVVIHFAARFETGSIRDAVAQFLPPRYLALVAVGFAAVVGPLFAGWPPDPASSPGSFLDGLTFWLTEGRAEEGRITYYLEWLVAGTPVLVGLAVVGSAGTVLRANSAWVRWIFLGWAGFVGLVLSLIGDQSWWNVATFFPPLALLAGYGLADLWLGLSALASTARGRRPDARAPRLSSAIATPSTRQALGGVVLPAVVGVLVVALATGAVATSTSPVGIERPNVTAAFGMDGVTVPDEPNARDRAFDAAREAALETECPGVVGPGVHVWPARWWFRGIEHDRATELEAKHLPAVVVARGRLSRLEGAGYRAATFDEHRVYVPPGDCDAQ